MNVKKKLARLKRAEERKILAEHRGVYDRLVVEHYARSAGEKKSFGRRFGWIFPVAGAVAAVTVITAAFIGFIGFAGLIGGATMKKNATPPIAEQPGGAVMDGENENGSVAYDTPVGIAAVKAALTGTTLATDGLRFKRVSVRYGADGKEYYEMVADTYNTFDVIVSTDPTFRPDGEEESFAEHTVNRHGFGVDYTITRRAQEDYYAFRTKATVDTGSEIYYIRYDYTSTRADCDLLDLIEYYIRPV